MLSTGRLTQQQPIIDMVRSSRELDQRDCIITKSPIQTLGLFQVAAGAGQLYTQRLVLVEMNVPLREGDDDASL